ncbi:MAG: hypothetical protein GY906_14280 [bacterium]|nr:hypothetical protein [bacterium]
MQTAAVNSTLNGPGESITTYVVYEASQRLGQMLDGETLSFGLTPHRGTGIA